MAVPFRLLVLSCIACIVALSIGARAFAASIVSSGPLTSITISPDLNCDVTHAGDAAPEWFAGTACGTLAVDESSATLYGPANIPAGGLASPRTPFTPISQTGPTGTGTSADPFMITTVAGLGLSGLTITQTDSYVTGQESHRTDVRISNAGPTDRPVRLYGAGDCYLQSSDFGFGRVDGGAVACAATADPGSRIEQLYPLTPGSSYYETFYNTMWARIGAQAAAPNTCDCAIDEDNAIMLSWDVNVPANGSVTVSRMTTFSPLGFAPLSTTKTADAATADAGSGDGYTITIHNPNTPAVAVGAITDTLPSGFAYVPGSTTGATTADPTISGRTLTWTGPFGDPGGGDVGVHFDVTVSPEPGTYFNNAGGDAGTVAVAPTGNTAPVTVQATAAAPTTLAVDDASGDFADTGAGSAVLTNTATGAGLAGKSVTLTLNGAESCAATTDDAGRATCSLTPTEAAGTYALAAAFAGDGAYAAATGSATFTVTHEEAALAYTGVTIAIDGQPATLSAVLTTDDPVAGTALGGRSVRLTLGSGTAVQSCVATTAADGTVSCTVAAVSQAPGAVAVTAGFAGDAFYAPASAAATVEVIPSLAGGAFVIGDVSAGSPTAGNVVTFWSARWAKANAFGGGAAPAEMKGFADTVTGTCGGTWTAHAGGSATPPAGLPSRIAALVSSSVTRAGSTIGGNIAHVVLVAVDPGYGPDPAHTGTGTIIGTIC